MQGSLLSRSLRLIPAHPPAAAEPSPPPCPCACRKWSFAACECFRVQPPAAAVRGAAACGPACTSTAALAAPLYSGTLDGLRKIAAREGVGVLWRGTDVALMMAIPMVGIYLPLYDYLLQQLQQEQAGAAAPLAAGTLARTAAVYCTAPFELARTRLQAAHSHAAAPAAAVAAGGPPVWGFPLVLWEPLGGRLGAACLAATGQLAASQPPAQSQTHPAAPPTQPPPLCLPACRCGAGRASIGAAAAHAQRRPGGQPAARRGAHVDGRGGHAGPRRSLLSSVLGHGGADPRCAAAAGARRQRHRVGGLLGQRDG